MFAKIVENLFNRVRPQIMMVIFALGAAVYICKQMGFSEGVIGAITGLSGIAGALIDAEIKKD